MNQTDIRKVKVIKMESYLLALTPNLKLVYLEKDPNYEGNWILQTYIFLGDLTEDEAFPKVKTFCFDDELLWFGSLFHTRIESFHSNFNDQKWKHFRTNFMKYIDDTTSVNLRAVVSEMFVRKVLDLDHKSELEEQAFIKKYWIKRRTKFLISSN